MTSGQDTWSRQSSGFQATRRPLVRCGELPWLRDPGSWNSPMTVYPIIPVLRMPGKGPVPPHTMSVRSSPARSACTQSHEQKFRSGPSPILRTNCEIVSLSCSGEGHVEVTGASRSREHSLLSHHSHTKYCDCPRDEDEPNCPDSGCRRHWTVQNRK